MNSKTVIDMCTIITPAMARRPRIAKKDIVCYKYGTRMGDHFCSMCQGFPYEKDLLYQQKMSYGKDISYFGDEEGKYMHSLDEHISVTEGFHALLNPDRHLSYPPWYNRKAKFIIPKGSKYHLNPAGRIVSNQIIFKEFI